MCGPGRAYMKFNQGKMRNDWIQTGHMRDIKTFTPSGMPSNNPLVISKIKGVSHGSKEENTIQSNSLIVCGENIRVLHEL